MTSKPLYERIIIDRSQRSLSGFTFEDITDNKYQDTYMYQQDPEDAQKTIYNAYLYKSPGFYKLIRQKAHHWGVETLCTIMMADRKIKEELFLKQ